MGSTFSQEVDDHTAKLWDLQVVRRSRRFEGPYQALSRSIAFSSDGQQILTGSWDHTAKLWDLQRSGRFSAFDWSYTALLGLLPFPPMAQHILTGSCRSDGQALGFAAGWRYRTFAGHTKARSESVCLFPRWAVHPHRKPRSDGQALGFGSGSGDTAHLQAIQKARQWSVAFSPDGQHILTGSDEVTAKLWKSWSYLKRTIESYSMGSLKVAGFQFLNEEVEEMAKRRGVIVKW